MEMELIDCPRCGQKGLPSAKPEPICTACANSSPPHKLLKDLVSPGVPYSGVMVKYELNTLYCARSRFAEINFESIKKALYALTGLHPDILFALQPDGGTIFEEDGGAVAYYITHGQPHA